MPSTEPEKAAPDLSFDIVKFAFDHYRARMPLASGRPIFVPSVSREHLDAAKADVVAVSIERLPDR